MFNVGSNNPNVGNDRRQQLIQKMAQQLAARYAQHQNMDPGFGRAGQVGADQLGGVFMQQKRRQAQVIAGAPTRAAGAGRETAGTDLIGNPIPGQASSQGQVASRPGRMTAHTHFNPAAGNPIPGQAAALPPPPPPPPAAAPAAAQPPTPAAAAPESPDAPPAPPPPAAPDPTGMSAGSVYNPVNPDSGQSAYVPSAPQSNTFVPNTQYQPAAFDASSGLVPLGGGRYLDLATGMIRGMPTGNFGGRGNGLTGPDGRF